MMGSGPGGAGVGDWGSGRAAGDGWTHERLLELDEAVVKKGGMPVTKVRALPAVAFNPARAAAEARAVAEADRAAARAAAAGEEETEGAAVDASSEEEDAEEEEEEVPASDAAPRHAGCPGEDCAVCLTDFVIGDELTLLPPCGHLFHGACLLPWLKTHRHCPKCRAPLCEEDECVARSGEGEDEGEAGEEGEGEREGVGSPLAGASIAISAARE